MQPTVLLTLLRLRVFQGTTAVDRCKSVVQIIEVNLVTVMCAFMAGGYNSIRARRTCAMYDIAVSIRATSRGICFVGHSLMSLALVLDTLKKRRGSRSLSATKLTLSKWVGTFTWKRCKRVNACGTSPLQTKHKRPSTHLKQWTVGLAGYRHSISVRCVWNRRPQVWSGLLCAGTCSRHGAFVLEDSESTAPRRWCQSSSNARGP